MAFPSIFDHIPSKPDLSHSAVAATSTRALHEQKLSYFLTYFVLISIGVPDRGAGGRGAVAPLGFGKLVKFVQMGWEIRAFRGLNFSR